LARLTRKAEGRRFDPAPDHPIRSAETPLHLGKQGEAAFFGFRLVAAVDGSLRVATPDARPNGYGWELGGGAWVLAEDVFGGTLVGVFSDKLALTSDKLLGPAAVIAPQSLANSPSLTLTRICHMSPTSALRRKTRLAELARAFRT
jgi:hypothetical protein